MTIIPSYSLENTFYLFRDLGDEIAFMIVNGKIVVISKGYLLPAEYEFIKQHYLK